MANRIIKESICTSEKIAELTDFEFRLWIGMITQADDAGRGDARPAILKGHIFPLRDRIAIKDIDTSVHALAAKGCVTLYTVGGRPYFWFPGWAKHQRIRDCKPKYPGPEEADDLHDVANLRQSAASCGELRQSAASCGLNPIQSESNSNPNPNPNPNSGAKTRLTPPTLEDVVAYCQERSSTVDPYKFFEHFDTGGWVDAKGQPVRNWKQKLLTWEKFGGDVEANAKKSEGHSAPNVARRENTQDIEAQLEGMRAYLQRLKEE